MILCGAPSWAVEPGILVAGHAFAISEAIIACLPSGITVDFKKTRGEECYSARDAWVKPWLLS